MEQVWHTSSHNKNCPTQVKQARRICWSLFQQERERREDSTPCEAKKAGGLWALRKLVETYWRCWGEWGGVDYWDVWSTLTYSWVCRCSSLWSGHLCLLIVTEARLLLSYSDWKMEVLFPSMLPFQRSKSPGPWERHFLGCKAGERLG